MLLHQIFWRRRLSLCSLLFVRGPHPTPMNSGFKILQIPSPKSCVSPLLLMFIAFFLIPFCFIYFILYLSFIFIFFMVYVKERKKKAKTLCLWFVIEDFQECCQVLLKGCCCLKTWLSFETVVWNRLSRAGLFSSAGFGKQIASFYQAWQGIFICFPCCYYVFPCFVLFLASPYKSGMWIMHNDVVFSGHFFTTAGFIHPWNGI